MTKFECGNCSKSFNTGRGLKVHLLRSKSCGTNYDHDPTVKMRRTYKRRVVAPAPSDLRKDMLMLCMEMMKRLTMEND